MTDRGYQPQVIADIVRGYVSQAEVNTQAQASSSSAVVAGNPSPPPGAGPAFTPGPPMYDYKTGESNSIND